MSQPSMDEHPPPTPFAGHRRGGALALVGSVAGSALGFAAVVVICRGLHARRAGAMLEAIALFTILATVAELGADAALVRMISRYRALELFGDLPGIVAVALSPVAVAGALLGAGMFVGAEPLSRALFTGAPPSEAMTFIRALAVFVPFAALSGAMVAGTRGFGTMAPSLWIVEVGAPLLRPILISLALALGLGDTMVGMAWGAPAALGAGVAAIWLAVLMLRRVERGAPRPLPTMPAGMLAGQYWRLAAPRGVAAIAAIALGWVGILIVGALRSTGEAGVYAAVSSFVGVGTFALQATDVAIAPQIGGLLARERRGEAQRLLQAATWWVVAASWPVYVVMAAFAPPLMRVFGSQFVAGATALSILAAAMLVAIGTGGNRNVLLAGGRSSWAVAITGLSLAGSLVADFVLIPRYGIEGAAVAHGSALVVDNVATTIAARVLMKLHPFGRGHALVVLASAVTFGGAAIAARAWLGNSGEGVAVAGVAASALYVPLLFAFRRRLRLDELTRSLRHPFLEPARRPVASHLAAVPETPVVAEPPLEFLARLRTESGQVEGRAEQLLLAAEALRARQDWQETLIEQLASRVAERTAKS